MERYQYIVIGAGPAGCYAAARLKKAGKSVLVLERNPLGFRKVCGDGISVGCMQRLKMLDFPAERFAQAGAIPIRFFYEVKQEIRKTDMLDDGRIAFGCSRDITDSIFQDYAKKDFGVEIVYDYKVKDIVDGGEEFVIGSYHADAIICANGVSSGIRINGQPAVRPIDRPFGVSMIVRSERVEKNPFFLFDRDWGSKHTYAWIFSIGERYYNIGMWKRSNFADIAAELMDFYHRKAGLYIEGETGIETGMRGAFLGIGEHGEETVGRVMYIGDAANSCNPLSGEGISEAVLSADRLVNRILDHE